VSKSATGGFWVKRVRYRYPLLLLWGILACFSLALAQVEVGVQGIVAYPLAPSGLSDAGLGSGGRLTFRYAINYRWRLGASVGYVQFPYAELSPIAPVTALEVAPAHTPLLVSLEYDFFRRPRYQVFGALELGLTGLREVEQSLPTQSRTATTATVPSLSPAVGIRYQITDALILHGQLGYAFAVKGPSELPIQGLGSSQSVQLAAGVLWRLHPENYPRKEAKLRRPNRRRM
jgi:hypothetical protein